MCIYMKEEELVRQFGLGSWEEEVVYAFWPGILRGGCMCACRKMGGCCVYG